MKLNVYVKIEYEIGKKTSICKHTCMLIASRSHVHIIIKVIGDLATNECIVCRIKLLLVIVRPQPSPSVSLEGQCV